MKAGGALTSHGKDRKKKRVCHLAVPHPKPLQSFLKGGK